MCKGAKKGKKDHLGLKRIVSIDDKASGEKVKTKLNIHSRTIFLKKKTVLLELQESNTYGKDLLPKPLLSEGNTEDLKKGCNERKACTLERWKCVIWSDVSLPLRFTLQPEESSFGEH